MNDFIKLTYGDEEVLTMAIEEHQDYTLYQRVHFHTITNKNIPCNLKDGYGENFANNLLENASERTIYNKVVDVAYHSIITKMFRNEQGYIYHIDILANILTNDVYRDMINNVKTMIHENKHMFDEFVDIELTFSPALDK